MTPYSLFNLTDDYDSDHDASPPPPSNKSTEPPEFLSRPNDLSDDDQEDDRQQQSGHLPRKGGYDSRIQQILYENPDMEIMITDAGKSAHGSFIEYRIRTGVCRGSQSVRMREANRSEGH